MHRLKVVLGLEVEHRDEKVDKVTVEDIRVRHKPDPGRSLKLV